jgi:class 3 adenylate cyclase
MFVGINVDIITRKLFFCKGAKMTKEPSPRKFSRKVGNTRVIPITSRIIIIFTISILVASFASNYINLAFNRAELIKMMKQLLVMDLKEIYDFSNTQYELYQYSKDDPDAYSSSMEMIESNALRQFKNKKSIALGLLVDDTTPGRIIFQAAKIAKLSLFPDKTALRRIKQQERKGIREGALTFYINREEYYGVYKYIPKWEVYLIRAEELNEFYEGSRRIFQDISIIIVVITFACTLIGIYIIRHITRFIDLITSAIMKMIQSQQLELIHLEGAANDNITFLGMAFNSLSSTINNLLSIFRKFVNKDIAVQAYQEKIVRLEGTQKELTILFTDIKGFTYMTETLGSDTIKILNLHYHQAIREIFQYDGLIGSIIGDALLAVFGIHVGEEQKPGNKSYQAILAGYGIQAATKELRAEMQERRAEVLAFKGSLTEEEEEVYQAVLLEVGVGIDGGMVFYGNIGSYERMTNTVIGDNVNAASRLEGLTRIYKVPIICSEYVKNDIAPNLPEHDIYFMELDTVQVKGKTVGQKIYWPIPLEVLQADRNLQTNLPQFETGLGLYYQGRWPEAFNIFSQCNLPPAGEFMERTRGGQPPEEWSGIWNIAMK